METAPLVTFEIETQDFKAFQHEFAKLARKATKLGVVTPTFEVIQHDKVIPAIQDKAGKVTRAARVVHVVTVTGARPKLAGWTFVAALQHEAGGNVVRTVPGVEIQVARDLRTAKPACEHCGLDRRRADTYVVAHDDGRQMQIGRTCLRDFTGHDSPETIARWAESLSAFATAVGSGEGEGFDGGSGEPVATLDEFLPFVCASIRLTGWLSRTQARERGGQATADHAWVSLFPVSAEDRRHAVKPEAQDIARAAKVCEVARAHFEAHATDTLPDYEHNVRIVVESVSVAGRTAGIAASIVNFAERLMGREIERRRFEAQKVSSAHVGTVGKRSTFILTVERVIDLEGTYGTTHLHMFCDAAGNLLKWFSSSVRLETGTTYAVVGTVKAQDEYKGAKQTVLTRCKATPLPTAESADAPAAARAAVG